MLEQYNILKKKHNDCILLFRLGDFYECFFNDAKILSKVLGLTLTGRGKEGNRTPMAGIPHHALTNYLPKLIEAGYKVAIADQLEEPIQGQIVKRDVTKIITAGTIIDENNIELSNNNYVISIFRKIVKGISIWGLSFCDISTGEFKVAEYMIKGPKLPRELIIEIFRLHPAEIVLPIDLVTDVKELFPQITIASFDAHEYYESELSVYLLKELQVESLKSFGLENLTSGITASGKLLSYIIENRKSQLPHIDKLLLYNASDYMLLDETTIRNLELISPIRQDNLSRTFFNVINHCSTPMGQRKLRQWILRPLIKKEQIEYRLNLVETILNNDLIYKGLQEKLNEITDFERALARLGGKSSSARDLIFIKNSLKQTLEIQKLLISSGIKIFTSLIPNSKDIDLIIEDVVDLIDKSILDNPSSTITEGDLIKDGYNNDLDIIKKEHKDGTDFIRNLEIKEIKNSGINSLKVRYNKVFGYYIEVSKSNINKVPSNYIRKQTLVNGERYITEELKIWEEKVLGASEKINNIEYKIFNEIRSEVIKFIPIIKENIEFVSNIDCFHNFAKLARDNNYTKTKIFDTYEADTEIIGGRHLVVESILRNEFVPNDVSFNYEHQQLIILTGPNMSGKSTYIRQVALIFLLAQMGSYVPALRARINIVDRIFTRVGASDNLARGESTFLVEMLESANILNNATEKSLIILDEVGRGTSTFDGVAIAWAIAEYITKNIKAKTLFATHYHELLLLEQLYNTVKNFKVEVMESNNQVSFMHKIVKGGIDKSYGIYVADLAGVPKEVITRSKGILKDLQNRSINKLMGENKIIDIQQMNFGMNKDEKLLQENLSTEYQFLKDELLAINLNTTTPFETMSKVNELQKKLKKI